MTLSQSVLESELAVLMDPDDVGFIGFPASAAIAAGNFATAYDRYANNTSGFGASQATDTSGDSAVSTNKAGFESALGFAQPGTAAGTAAEFGAAVAAFWAGATFGIGSIGCLAGDSCACANVGGTGLFAVKASSVVSAVNSAPLISALTTELEIESLDGAAKAAAIAADLHVATTSDVTVLITGLDTTTPTPLPITNTCQVL